MTKLFTSALVGMLFLAGFATTAAAQRPTPEGTAIRNFATASYTDARGNQYAGVSSDTATVTVGFLGAPAASNTGGSPAPNTTNWMAFTLTNVGNGRDTLRVESAPVFDGVTASGGFRIGATTYADLAALNAALSAVQVDTAGGTNPSVTVEVGYAVGTAAGSIVLVVGSTRDLTSPLSQRTDTSTATISAPALTYGVSVSAPADSSIQAGSTTYGVFSVVNTSNVPATFTLSRSALPAGVTIGAITDMSGSAITSTGSMAAGDTVQVRVYFTMPPNTLADTVVGDSAWITLAANGDGTASAASDTAVAAYVIAQPVGTLEFTKVALKDDGTPLTASDRVLPGEFIRYRVTVSQPAGAGSLTGIVVTDSLSSNLIYDSVIDAAGLWGAETLVGGTSDGGTPARLLGGTVTVPFSGTLAAGTSASVIIRVQVR